MRAPGVFRGWPVSKITEAAVESECPRCGYRTVTFPLGQATERAGHSYYACPNGCTLADFSKEYGPTDFRPPHNNEGELRLLVIGGDHHERAMAERDRSD